MDPSSLSSKISTELKSVKIPFRYSEQLSAQEIIQLQKNFLSKSNSINWQNGPIFYIEERFRRSAESVLLNLMYRMNESNQILTSFDNGVKLVWEKNQL
jgi:hypothetical protein